MPTDSEISVTYDFIKLMKPIVEMTLAIGGQKCVTISSIRLLIHKITQAFYSPMKKIAHW